MARLNKLSCALLLCAALHGAHAKAQSPGLQTAEPSTAVRTQDPYEPYNRVMFKINNTADRYVLAPVARGYRAVLPSPIRRGVSNFFDNLRDVVSFGSNLLRADIKRASEDFIRVGLNTTFGLGGLINLANAGGIPDNKNTLGDTFASWGWKNSSYFVPPLMGPSTVRDTLGSAVTAAYPVQNAVFATTSGRIAAAAGNIIDTREKMLDLTDSLDGAAIDPYAYTRDFYLNFRNKQTGTTNDTVEEIDIDSLVEPEQNAPAPDSPALPADHAADSITEPDIPAAGEANSHSFPPDTGHSPDTEAADGIPPAVPQTHTEPAQEPAPAPPN